MAILGYRWQYFRIATMRGMRIVTTRGPRYRKLRKRWIRKTCRHNGYWRAWRVETEDWFRHLEAGEELFVGCWRSCARCGATQHVTLQRLL